MTLLGLKGLTDKNPGLFNQSFGWWLVNCNQMTT